MTANTESIEVASERHLSRPEIAAPELEQDFGAPGACGVRLNKCQPMFACFAKIAIEVVDARASQPVIFTQLFSGTVEPVQPHTGTQGSIVH